MSCIKSISFILLVISLLNSFVTSTPYKQRSSIFNHLNEAIIDDDIPEFPKEFIDIVSKGSREQTTDKALSLSDDIEDTTINKSSENKRHEFPPTSTFSFTTIASTVPIQESKTNDEENENSSVTPVIESPIAINIMNEENNIQQKQEEIIIKLMPGNSKNTQSEQPLIPIYSTIGIEDFDNKGNQLPSPLTLISENVDENNELHKTSTTLLPPTSTSTTTTMTTTGTTTESSLSSLSSTTATSIPLYVDPMFPVPQFTVENTTKITTIVISQEQHPPATTLSTLDTQNNENKIIENTLTPEVSFPSPTLDEEKEQSGYNVSEIDKRSQDNNDYDDDTTGPRTLELKPLKGSPCPGFTRQCNSYFDCDFHPNGADENDTRTWFKCDGKHCVCELLGYIRDDEAEWNVAWSKKSQKCMSDLDGPCGVNDGLEIHCSKSLQCINNVCDNSDGVKAHKDKKNKVHKESQNDTDTITSTDDYSDIDCDNSTKEDHGNIFSLLFFPHMNIFDSILNDSLNNIREIF